VAQGESIASFYYTIAGATGATVTGLPDGLTGTLSGSDFTISGTVSATAAVGSYSFTVTTTGATTNASKTGTITVTAATSTVSSSSSEKVSSSSSETVFSSSSETVSSSSEVAISSSSEIEEIGTENPVDENEKTAIAQVQSLKSQVSLSPAVISSTSTLRFTVERSGIVQVTLLNAMGIAVHSERVKANAGSNAVNISRGKISSGTYYLNVRGAGLNFSRRVNVE
jgi:pectate lyase